jgi:mono/diheme cytochrome c family protein
VTKTGTQHLGSGASGTRSTSCGALTSGIKKLQQANENTLICSKVCAGWSAEKEMLMELIGRASLVCTLILCGCQVSKPGKVESKMMKTVKHKLTVGGKGALNPIPPTADNIADGREHFAHHCGICHGLDGQGTGVPFAAKMSPPVADLSSKDVQDYADGQIKWVIENGLDPSGMPAWNGLLSDEEMWKIVDYIRHLPAKGSLGIPDVYKAEQKQHQHMQGEKHHQ